jgi:hypothetical protein
MVINAQRRGRDDRIESSIEKKKEKINRLKGWQKQVYEFTQAHKSQKQPLE